MAREAGFARVGVARADISFDESGYRAWLSAGRHGDMAYLARSVAERHAPGQLVEGARSIICLALSYAPGALPRHGHLGNEQGLLPGRDGRATLTGDAHATSVAAGDGIIAHYARGRDYHKVLKQRCRRLMDALRAIEPSFAGRAFVDTAPIAERQLAAAAGLGWIGRNGCLIADGLGSYVVLCEIICNLPLSPDEPCRRDCGDCRLCIDACPTGAIVADGVVDARLCRSYLTIEHRGGIGPALWPKMGSCVFGCDACQAACPHNTGVPPGDDELTCPEPVEGACPEPVEGACPEPVEGACPEPVEGAQPHGSVAELTIAEVLTWSEADWDAVTRGSAMRRATYEMFIRNTVLAAGNSGDCALIAPVTALQTRRADLADEIAWALGQIRSR